MKITILTIAILSFTCLYSQNVEFNNSPCCDSNGVINDPYWFIPKPYTVKRYKRKYNYEINIKQFRIGTTEFNINLVNNGRIKSSTPLIKLTENYAIKIHLGKAYITEGKTLLMKMDIYVKDSESNCWRLQQSSPTYYTFKSNPNHLGIFSYGLPEGGFYISQGQIKIKYVTNIN